MKSFLFAWSVGDDMLVPDLLIGFRREINFLEPSCPKKNLSEFVLKHFDPKNSAEETKTFLLSERIFNNFRESKFSLTMGSHPNLPPLDPAAKLF